MNTDLELLVLAYKAAFNGANLLDDKDMLKHWNPLAKNGDAFCLMVILKLSSIMSFLSPSGGEIRSFWSPNSKYDGGKSETTEEEYSKDPFAATRRAIVCAAAEIGRRMA